MPLTRAWAIILAFLATACLAGMFLLSSNTGGGFSGADHAAVRAITEAGVAALESQLQGSPVQQADSLARDPRLKEALAAEPDPDDPDALEARLYDAVSEVAEETRVGTGSNMTVAIIDANGAVMAASGVVEKDLPQLVASAVFQEAPDDDDILFSITLGEQIHVAKLLRPDAKGRRLVAVEPLEIGAGSLLRRVLGSSHPAGLVRKGQLLGDIIGNQPVTEELIRLAREHASDAPNEGASKVFTVGEGIDARLGSLGRIPGPAGQGEGGAMLVVLSTSTAAAGQRDMAQALADARGQEDTGLPWPLLGGFLVVTVGLAFYLPGLEGLTPMRRLGREFSAIAQGTQHSIFHDRYGGTAGEVARAAAAAHEALRQAYLAELEIDEEEPDEPGEARPRTSRGRRATTRSQRNTAGTGPRPSRGRRNDASRDGASSSSASSSSRPAVDREAALDQLEELDQPTTPRTAGSRARRSTPPPTSTARPGPPPTRPVPPAAEPSLTGPAAPPPAPAPAAAAPPPVPRSAVDQEAYFRGVYDEFLRIKTQCGEPTANLSFEKFAQKLAKNTADIKGKKPGVKDVRFTVYVKDGKAALKAKIVKE